MPDSNAGMGTAAAEITAPTELARTLTLFQIEESLALLAESAEEEGLTPEIQAALTAFLQGPRRNATAQPSSSISAKPWRTWQRRK